LPLFDLPQAVWKFLDAIQESQRRQAEAQERIANHLGDVATLLDEIRVALHKAEEGGGSP
jgi:Na+/H+ antiporter NhaB